MAANLKKSFEQLSEAYSRLSVLHTFSFQVGPYVIRLEFVSRSLVEKIERAFLHLEVASSFPPDLTLCLWDAEETKLTYGSWSQVVSFDYLEQAVPPHYFHYFPAAQAMSFIDLQEGKAHYIIRDAAQLPWWVSGSPLQAILHLFFRQKGIQLTHTAAIGTETSCLLLTGKGGSGKSTTTLSCLQEGLFSLGEDYCLLDPRHLTCYSLYQSAKWKPATRKLVPGFDSYIANPEHADREKALAFYRDFFPHQMKKTAPIQAIVSLQIEERRQPLLRPYNPIAGLRDLMMSTLLLPFYHTSTLRILSDLTHRLPHHQLLLSQDLKANVQILKELLA